MTVSTTRNLMDCARQFHQDVAAYCTQTAKLSQNERIKMLLEYIGRHEQHLSETVAAYEAQGKHKIMDTWFRNVPTAITDPKSIKTLGADATVDDVINWAIKVDDAIIEFYETISEEAEIPEVREAVNNLLAMENREKLNMVRSAMRINDL